MRAKKKDKLKLETINNRNNNKLLFYNKKHKLRENK